MLHDGHQGPRVGHQDNVLAETAMQPAREGRSCPVIAKHVSNAYEYTGVMSRWEAVVILGRPPDRVTRLQQGVKFSRAAPSEHFAIDILACHNFRGDRHFDGTNSSNRKTVTCKCGYNT